jgi:hypothetical protein
VNTRDRRRDAHVRTGLPTEIVPGPHDTDRVHRQPIVTPCRVIAGDGVEPIVLLTGDRGQARRYDDRARKIPADGQLRTGPLVTLNTRRMASPGETRDYVFLFLLALFLAALFGLRAISGH